MKLDMEAVKARREAFFRKTCEILPILFHPDGEGKTAQFNPPHREPVWILPALYEGRPEDVALANRIVARYHTANNGAGNHFDIFQSTLFPTYLVHYRNRLTPEAEAVMLKQCEYAFDPHLGAARSDYKFHGCNDNMPAMAAKALILGGQALNDKTAYESGVWRLQSFRRLLERSAWCSEFNSSTYSAVTVASMAHIAQCARDPEIAALARDCEYRIWADVVLHYHPGTKLSGGPQSRSYECDAVGHTHSLQVLFWMLFGTDATGRDPIDSFFNPDGIEVLHFQGNPHMSIAEYCDFMSPNYNYPADLVPLFHDRKYPARVKGRAESMIAMGQTNGEYHTDSYMEAEYSLGSVDVPMGGGEQTMQCFATYRLKPEVKNFRDAATIFHRYSATAGAPAGDWETSVDGFGSEKFHLNLAYCYTMQKDNTVLLLTQPNLKKAPFAAADALKLSVVFPAHYGRIKRTIMGAAAARDGVAGSSETPVPASVEAGEVYVHVQPLILSALPRREAMRFSSYRHYESLDLINYEGPKRDFDLETLRTTLNGFVFTIDAKRKWESLEAFHAAKSKAWIMDYFWGAQRFVRYIRDDVQFEVVYVPEPFGVQTRALDGRMLDLPLYESNQLDSAKLPLLTGPITIEKSPLPWTTSMVNAYDPNMTWMIGARGAEGEIPYAQVHASFNRKP